MNNQEIAEILAVAAVKIIVDRLNEKLTKRYYKDYNLMHADSTGDWLTVDHLAEALGIEYNSTTDKFSAKELP